MLELGQLQPGARSLRRSLQSLPELRKSLVELALGHLRLSVFTEVMGQPGAEVPLISGLHFAHDGSGLTSTGKLKIHFGTGNDSAEDYYYIQIGTSTASALGVGNQAVGTDGLTVSTQEAAQKALVAITNAVVSKDKIRAHLGALQNRLENTISNLTTQSENLQAAESRISDVDVATEMTTFVRNQILTQSSVAMLSQANSMPRMAMTLISG